jgi:hypothetical protein
MPNVWFPVARRVKGELQPTSSRGHHADAAGTLTKIYYMAM